MLFTIIVIAAVVAIAIYVAKKTKSTSVESAPTVIEEPITSIHEEIAKAVEEAKAQAPIVEEPIIEAPKMDAKPKKKPQPKKKQTNA